MARVRRRPRWTTTLRHVSYCLLALPSVQPHPHALTLRFWYTYTDYGTWMRHRNCAYQNFTQAGVRVGGGIFAHNGSWVHGGERMATAEVSYRNCVFRGNTIGIALYSYNDLDQVVSGCHFEDNKIGIFTPHGNFYLYNSRFERSTMFDTYWGAPGSSARRVVSVNSTSPLNRSVSEVDTAWCLIGVPHCCDC